MEQYNYLRPSDYNRAIAKDNLDKVTSEDPTILEQAELSSIEEVASILRGVYDTEHIFRPLYIYEKGASYQPGDKVVMDAPAWVQGTTYAVGSWVSYQGWAYRLLTLTGYLNTVAPSTSSTWECLLKNDSIYTALPDGPEFKYLKSYIAGDIIVHGGKAYTCIKDTLYNFPNNTTYWTLTGAGAPLSTAPEPDKTLSTGWVRKDPRNPGLVMALADVVLYHLHSRINPRNIPEIRAIRYDGNSPEQTGGAMGWLKRGIKDSITLDLMPLPKEVSKNLPSYGNSNPKQTHYY